MKLRLVACAGACAVFLALGVARAELVHRHDGSTLEGVILMQEADGTLVVYTADGTERVPWSEVARVDRSHQVSKTLARRAAKAQIQLAKRIRRRQRNAQKDDERALKKLLDRYGRSTEPAKRAEIEAELEGYPAPARVGALQSVLDDSREATRALARRRLRALGTPEALDALVRVALTCKKQAIRDETHGVALELDGDRARRIYEAVAAAQTKPERRLRALGFLAGMRERRSIPGLIHALAFVLGEIKAQLVTEGESRTPAPVSLSGGRTSIPVELPVVGAITVKANVGIPTLRKIAARAAGALATVTGEDYGEDVAAWETWWSRQPKPKPPAEQPEAEAPQPAAEPE